MKQSAQALAIFLAMLAVYMIPIAIILGALWVTFKIGMAFYNRRKKVKRAKRVKRLREAVSKVEREFGEEADFLNSI